MKLIKLIKTATKTSNKSVEQRIALVDQIVAVSDSAQAVARTVHCKAWTRWSAVDFKELEASFKAQSTKQNVTSIALLTKKQKRQLVVAIASDVGRSPMSVVAKLRDLKLIPAHVRFGI